MKTVIEMAREAGWPDSLIAPVIMAKLTEFAELVRADEREACAKVCEPQEKHDDPLTAWKIAEAIRARGQK